MSSFPLYQQRVREFVTAIYNLTAFHLNLVIYNLLHAVPQEYWIDALEEMTLPELKEILNSTSPPSWTKLRALPDALSSSDLGTYFVYVFAYGEPSNHGYNGSATSADMLVKRGTRQHMDPSYRASHKGHSLLYNILDDPKVARVATIVQTGAYKGLEDGSPDSIIDMRLTCIVHETFIQTMPGTFCPDKPNSTRQIFRDMCPWSYHELEWLPTTGRVPLKEDFKMPGHTIEIDPKQRASIKRARWAAYAHAARQGWSDERREHERETKRSQAEQILKPIKAMRKHGISEEEIDKWESKADIIRASWLKLNSRTRPTKPAMPPTPLEMVELRKRKEREEEKEEEQKRVKRMKAQERREEQKNAIAYGEEMEEMETKYLKVYWKERMMRQSY